MRDEHSGIWDSFLSERERDLFHRFPGWYRAVAVETNDPLRMGRVRFKCPELHNFDLEAKDCPWAQPAPSFGGLRSGSWDPPVIGDHVWIAFEKSHPYNAVWTAGADPSRRKLYPYFSLYGKTPLSVNLDGTPADTPTETDMIKEYLPKDERPMSHGITDSYGTTFILSSVGYFPKSHGKKPAEAGVDGISEGEYAASQKPPEINKPDLKYAALFTKYGVTTILSDVGYKWDEEFKGDPAEDEQFEIDRYNYMTKLLNENEPENRDQRRYEVRTRYGHKVELRDVGWEKSRAGEFSDAQKNIGDSGDKDERWIKIRSKAGHLFQMNDVGSDAKQDKYVKRLLKSEVGQDTEMEEVEIGRDQRGIRMLTRHGYKLSMDDRGSDSKDATGQETPHGNGISLMGRKNRDDGDTYFIGFNEKDEYDWLMLTTPKSQGVTFDDRFDHVMMHTELPKPVSPDKKRQYEFATYPPHRPLGRDAERTTYHIKLDKKNKYARMKTPTGQGVEFRDPGNGQPCGNWAEIRDSDDRGQWFNTDGSYAIWRSKEAKQYIVLHDGADYILIKNTTGKIQIVANGGDVEVKTDQNIKLDAGQNISIKAGAEICMEAAGSQFTIHGGEVGTNTHFKCERMSGTHTAIPIPLHPIGPAPPAPISCSPQNVSPEDVAKKKPADEDEDRACAPNKVQAGPIPAPNAGGGGGPGGDVPGTPNDPLPTPDDPLPFPPDEPDDPGADPPPPFEPNPDDPLPNGCLWYGTTDIFKDQIIAEGLLIATLQNNLNTPDNPTDLADKWVFTTSSEVARGEDFALLAQQRYGGKRMLIKINGVEEPEKLIFSDPDEILVEYTGEQILPQDINIFDIESDELTTPPEFEI